MNNNQLPLVTCLQARRLKTAGFDWSQEYCYGTDAVIYHYGRCQETTNRCKDYFSAPTVALALKWMRDAGSIGYEIRMSTVCDSQWTAHITGMEFNIGWFDTYEAAESALLDELLKLIEK